MMPDGDTAAHLRKQVGGLFLGTWRSLETARFGFRLDPNRHAVAVASCLVLRERTDILQLRTTSALDPNADIDLHKTTLLSHQISFF
jgi:hypothetical protein